jgi:aspartyl aminopeptidase
LKKLVQNSLDRRTFISIFINEFITIYHNIDQIKDKTQKEAYTYLSEILTSNDEENQDLFNIIVESFSDMQ